MKLLPFSRPHTSLHLTARKLCYAQLAPSWRTPSRVSRYAELPLPGGLVRLSPIPPLITNTGALQQILEPVISASSRRPESVAITLPDLCARTAIFELAALPKNEQECLALIRWRFEKDLNVTTANARIAYRSFQGEDASPATSSPTQRPIRVLATLLHPDVIEPLEKLCLQAGLIPVSVNLASLSVFAWCHSAIAQCQRNRQPGHAGSLTVLFFFADWGLSCLILHERTPVFLRIKPLQSPRHDTTSDSHAEFNIIPATTETAHRSEESDSPPGDAGQESSHVTETYIETLADESIATLQYFFESQNAPKLSEGPEPVLECFLVGSCSPTCILPRLSERVMNQMPALRSDPMPFKIIALYTHPHVGLGQTVAGVAQYSDAVLSSIAAPLVHA